MKDHNDCIRAYHRSSKAWYAKANDFRNIEVNFGMYEINGLGTSGEMTMEWVHLGGKDCARLKSFEDSWSALSLFTDLIQKMGELDSELIQEDEFCKLLDECGFKDFTAYNDPFIKNSESIKDEDLIEITIHKDKAKKLGLI